MTASKNICVYCGSNSGNRSDYIKVAKELAKALVERNLGLVYGGASVGIMGVLADEVLRLNGSVTGVIPQSFIAKEVGHRNLTHMHVVSSMHERKSKMVELSDGFIAMPGGLGTLEEIFEVLTWAQLGFHAKPCGLLNICGYFNHLKAFLMHGVDEGFIKQHHIELMIENSSPSQILDHFENYKPSYEDKWVNKKQLNFFITPLNGVLLRQRQGCHRLNSLIHRQWGCRGQCGIFQG